MATRLLCHAFVRQFRLTQQQSARTWARAAMPNIPTYNLRTLHVRVSDQEAGLDAKRQSNQATLSLEREIDNELDDESITSNRRLRISRRKFIRGVNEKDSEAEQTAEQAKDETIATATSAGKKDELVLGADADTFGNTKFDTIEDEGDIEEEAYISRPTRRSKKLATKEYAQIIKTHLNAHRLAEALAVLEVRMLKEDRVKPENYIYNLLISGCAKAGYTRKAFSLFTKMRQRGLKVTGGTYTSLFNACANSPLKSDGLAKAEHVREIMLEKGYEPNVKNYNAMIKAYGRCGDVKTAYLLADEMIDRKLPLNAETFNFLLQACASDFEFGFRHCLLTWHKMLKYGISPDYYSFNAVIRCTRDCGFGDLETMQQVLQQIAPHAETENPKQLMEGNPFKQAIEENGNESTSKENPQQLTDDNPFKQSLEKQGNELPVNRTAMNRNLLEISSMSTQLEIPNLLLPKPHLGSLVALAEVTRPHDRFLLLGGLSGFLERMKSYNVTPDIETFTTMLEVIPPTNAAEKQLLSFVRKIGLKADIDFFNILIKKRSMRFDYESAREVLSMIRTAGLKPDIVTYGVLALGCRTQEEARELLQQMQVAGVRMNIQILGAMLRQGCAQKAFSYVNEIMQISLDESIRPNEAFLRHLHNFYKQCARAIDARHPSTKGAAFKKGHAKFCDKYRLYYEEHGLTGLKLEDAIKQIKQRPYQQFKETQAEGMEPLKNEKQSQKQKIRKYIKKIKIDNLRDDPPAPDKKQKQTQIE